MKKLSNYSHYSRELADDKDRIVRDFGEEITLALLHEYYGLKHNMNKEEKISSTFESAEYQTAIKDLNNAFFECENLDQNNYQRNLSVGTKN